MRLLCDEITYRSVSRGGGDEIYKLYISNYYIVYISNTMFFKYDFFITILHILSLPVQYCNKKIVYSK